MADFKINKTGTGGITREREMREKKKGSTQGGDRIEGAAAQTSAPDAPEKNRVEGFVTQPADPSAEKDTNVSKYKPGPASFKKMRAEKMRGEERRSRRDRSRSCRSRKDREETDASENTLQCLSRESCTDATGEASNGETASMEVASGSAEATEELARVSSEPGLLRERAQSAPTPKSRGRGRPPTTFKWIGYGKLREEKREAQWQLEKQELRKELLEGEGILTGIAQKRSERMEAREREGKNALLRGVPTDVAQRSTTDLREGIIQAAESVEKVAKKSGNLKGTFMKELKESAVEIREIGVEYMRRLQAHGDVRGLESENADLRLEVDELKMELKKEQAIVVAMKKRGYSYPLSQEKSTDIEEGRMETDTPVPSTSFESQMPLSAARTGEKRKAKVLSSSDSEGETRQPKRAVAETARRGRSPPPSPVESGR